MTDSPFSSIEAAVEALRAGRFVVVVDDEDRENEGDLVIAAEKVTPQAINFMARDGRGLICLALTEERCDALELPPMVQENTSNFGTAFTVSIEARGRTTTGISAADRAATVLTAIDPATRPSDLQPPGPHVPAARPAGRRPEAGGTDGGLRRSGADRGARPLGRALRGHERGRHDGPRPGPREVLRADGPSDGHGRRPDPIPDEDRAAGRADRGARTCRRALAISGSSRTAAK